MDGKKDLMMAVGRFHVTDKHRNAIEVTIRLHCSQKKSQLLTPLENDRWLSVQDIGSNNKGGAISGT